MKIGVFDSGIGGKSVAEAIQRALPGTEVLFVNDSKHVPYGLRTHEEIYGFVQPIFRDLEAAGCDVIVVACNTVSTTLINKLRNEAAVPLIAMEPMVKPAAKHTKTNTIVVCAIPLTLKSERYKLLKDTYATDVTVLEPDCSRWAYWIEHSEMNDAKIRAAIEPALDKGADVIVLGCTHYHWIEAEITRIAANRAEVLQPELPVIAQLKRVLAQLV